MAYNKDTDYSLLMQQAADRGNYAEAAQYEQLRNEKIQGEGLNYATTNQYSQYLQPEGYTGSSNNVYTYDNDQASIQEQMNQNSIAWWNADAAGKKALEEANKKLAAQLGGSVTFNPQTGYWGGNADAPLSLDTGVDMELPEFDLSDYGERPTFDAMAAVGQRPSFDLSTAVGEKPTYTSQYDAKIDALLNQILNREKFSYDAETDPLYQQYKTQYTREGNRAMNDTMAAAASNAGGMNSFAMTAAQQANDYYSAQLADKIPELYQLAYSMYMDDLAGQRNDLSMLQSAENLDYSKYLDSLGQWNTDRNFAYGAYRDQMGDWENDRDFAYGSYRDSVSDWENDRNFGYSQYRDQMGDYQWGTEFNYGAQQDLIAQNQWKKEFDYMKQQDELDREQWAQEFAYQQSKGSSGGGGGGYDPQEEEEGDLGYDPGTEEEGDVDPGKTALRNEWDAILSLGIGAADPALIVEIERYGGIVENSDGSLSWANGWSKTNYQNKLKAARGLVGAGKTTVDPLWYLGGSTLHP